MTDDDAGGWLASRLGSARADAERIARELADAGHLTREQSASVVAAVDAAIVRGRELLAEALREPQRLLRGLRARRASAGASAASPGAAASSEPVGHERHDVGARLAAIDERLAILEAAVLGTDRRARRGSEGD